MGDERLSVRGGAAVKVPRLNEIRNERSETKAKELRRGMYGHIRNIIKESGSHIAGYAVVIWDDDGHNYSVIQAGGPIKSRILPSFVHDSVQQHVTIDIVQAEEGKK